MDNNFNVFPKVKERKAGALEQCLILKHIYNRRQCDRSKRYGHREHLAAELDIRIFGWNMTGTCWLKAAHARWFLLQVCFKKAGFLSFLFYIEIICGNGLYDKDATERKTVSFHVFNEASTVYLCKQQLIRERALLWLCFLMGHFRAQPKHTVSFPQQWSLRCEAGFLCWILDDIYREQLYKNKTLD